MLHSTISKPMIQNAPRNNAQKLLPSQEPTGIKYISMGQFYVSKQPMEVRTVLGSCISVCVFDPLLEMGGMNHFLTPGDMMLHDATAQYGIFAMEFLINEMLIAGAKKDRLQLKLFGGGAVMSRESKIGGLNIDFIREYVADEKLNVVGESLGGDYARRICFMTHTGQARQMRVQEQQKKVAETEQAFVKKVVYNRQKPTGGTAEMF